MSGSCPSNIYLDMGYRSNPQRANINNTKSFDKILSTKIETRQRRDRIQNKNDKNKDTIFGHFVNKNIAEI